MKKCFNPLKIKQTKIKIAKGYLSIKYLPNKLDGTVGMNSFEVNTMPFQLNYTEQLK